MVNIGDCFYLSPAFSGKTEREENTYIGTVLSIHNGRYARVDFSGAIECFFLDDLEKAQRARSPQ